MTPSIAPLQNVTAFIGLVERVLNRAQGLPGMATFHGPSGWGKSRAVTVAGNNFQAYCVMVKDCWTPTYLCQAILSEMGIEAKRGVAAMVDQIAHHLIRVDRPLIIDDAQYLLRKRMIELVRDIYESSHAPVIIVGEEKLPQDLTSWENIYNRQLAWLGAEPCNYEDALQLTEIYAPKIHVADDLLARIVEISAGSVRRVSTNLAAAEEAALSRGQRHADLSFWGDRAFHTGLPPAARRPDELAKGQSMSLIGNVTPVRRVAE